LVKKPKRHEEIMSKQMGSIN